MVDARTEIVKYHKSQPILTNDLVVNEPTFFISVARDAYIHEDVEEPEFVTLVNTGADPVDIHLPTLVRYTNSIKKEQACSLLEMAIANDALQLYIIHNDFWKTSTRSALRGIPIVNTELLLRSIVPSKVGDETCFQTQNTTVVEDVTYSIQIHVEQVSHSFCIIHKPLLTTTPLSLPVIKEPFPVANGLRPKTPDFVLSCLQTELQRAYKIRFALTSHSGDEIPRYWVGYFDASPRKTAPAVGFRKRRFTPEDEDDEDE